MICIDNIYIYIYVGDPQLPDSWLADGPYGQFSKLNLKI